MGTLVTSDYIYTLQSPMNNLYKADLTKSTKENTYYSLAMFPYPS